MGALDGLDLAFEFVESTGTESFPMIWDPGVTTWTYYDIPHQVYSVLLDANGVVVGSWSGAVPEDEILGLIA